MEVRQERNGKLYPLEFAIRPGGGVVNFSVEALIGKSIVDKLISVTAAIPDKATELRVASVGSGLFMVKEGGVLQP